MKDEQEAVEAAKRKATEDAALKEKDARVQEIRERLEAKAAERKQKREEERQRAKQAAAAVRNTRKPFCNLRASASAARRCALRS